jgi:tetratricopeptide (TPR) repeat protein
MTGSRLPPASGLPYPRLSSPLVRCFSEFLRMLRELFSRLVGTSPRGKSPLSDARELIARGQDALQAERFQEAEELAGAVLACAAADDTEAAAFLLRARARTRRRDFQGALEDYQAVLELWPACVTAMIEQASVLHVLWRLDEALVLLDSILQIDSALPVAHNNRGLVLRELGRLDEAETALRRAVRCDGGYLDARANLARILIEQARLDEAETELVEALALDPGHVEARWNRAMLHLLRGEFVAGWHYYESRLEREDSYRRPYRYPRWDGRRIDTGSLLIHAEQGLGDEILFASCFNDAIERVEHCIIECEPRLEKLFARSFPRAHVMGTKFQQNPSLPPDAPPVAFQIPAGSLPALFRSAPADFPVRESYLSADPEKVERWRARFRGLGAGPTIGVAWTGGSLKTRRAVRSVPLARLLPLLRTPGARFVSLQYMDSGPEIAEVRSRYGVQVHHWPEAIADYDETAALVSALDLVISVTTAVVHLAGALGTPVWVLVPSSPEWRYLQRGSSIPWYPSARLFRQSRAGDWTEVIDEVCAALGNASMSWREHGRAAFKP